MNRTIRATVLIATVISAALVSAQDSVRVAEAPCLTDAAQAQTQAAEKGLNALIYFFSET
jgi:hypothetical protein